LFLSMLMMTTEMNEFSRMYKGMEESLDIE
jgi:hypothetical protein